MGNTMNEDIERNIDTNAHILVCNDLLREFMFPVPFLGRSADVCAA